MDQLITISAALADHGRVRALLACRKGELCACQLIALLQLAPSTVSRHMAILRQAGLVMARKEGRWMHYRLPEPRETSPLARAMLELVLARLARSDQIAADDKAIARITELDPQDLCRLQKSTDPECCSIAGPAKTRSVASLRRTARTRTAPRQRRA